MVGSFVGEAYGTAHPVNGQSKNASDPIDMPASPPHIRQTSAVLPLNAALPMLVTLDGIVTVVIATHKENAETPTVVTLDGITTLVSAVQL